MFLLMLFTTIIITLFIYTSVITISRQMENNIFNNAFQIDFEVHPLDILEKNKYIDSIWYSTPENRIIYTESHIQNIQNKQYIVLQNKWLNDKRNTFWDIPFFYENKMLIPYIQKKKRECLAIMFPFYL